MNALETLIYVSTAKEKLRMSDVVHIIRASEALNKRGGVSGMLLYSEQRFMQCLEGSLEGVQDAYWRIINSTAHHGIVEVFNGTVNARRFANWEWAYRSEQTHRFSSPATKRFLDQKNICKASFIEQAILASFWDDPVGAKHLWAA
jgi:hypothetical protein